MQKQSWSRFLSCLVYVLFIIQAFTALIPITQPNNTTLTTGELSCTKSPFPWQPDTRPRDSDCATAIQRLPQLPYQGQFHLNGPDDGFKLPLNRVFGKCRVSIEIHEGGADSGSWIGIRVAARRLKDDCLKEGRLGVARTGGWIMAGVNNLVVVKLMKVKLRGAGIVEDELLVDRGLMRVNQTGIA